MKRLLPASKVQRYFISWEKQVPIMLKRCAYRVIAMQSLMGNKLLMKIMLSYPPVTKNLLSCEKCRVSMLELCLVLYFFSKSKGSKERQTLRHSQTVKPCSWPIPSKAPSELKTAVLTGPLKLNYPMMKFPCRLKIVACPEQSMAIRVTLFGEMRMIAF